MAMAHDAHMKGLQKHAEYQRKIIAQTPKVWAMPHVEMAMAHGAHMKGLQKYAECQREIIALLETDKVWDLHTILPPSNKCPTCGNSRVKILTRQLNIRLLSSISNLRMLEVV